jgi:uncharacterized protein YkwD
MTLRKLLFILAALMAPAALSGCGGGSSAVYTVPANIAAPAAPGAREEVLRLVNMERGKAGLAPLTFSEELRDSAQFHADHMAFNDCYAHNCPGEPELSDRIREAGYRGHPGGENIHTGQLDPARVVTGWMNSKGHRENILNKGYKEAGVGHGYNPKDDGKHPYYHYWVLNFGFGSPETVSGKRLDSSEFVPEVIALINAERTKRGLNPLVVNEKLNRSAQFHTDYMAEKDCYEHECPGGPKLTQRIRKFGYVYTSTAENIAAGYSSPAEAAVGWMNSPGHRRNILTPEFTDVGAGYVYLPNDGGKEQWGHYWTMNFGATVSDYSNDRPLGSPDPLTTFLDALNRKRREAGQAPFNVDERLNLAAKRRAAYFASNGCSKKKCTEEPSLGEYLEGVGYAHSGISAQMMFGLMKPVDAAQRLGDSALIRAKYTDIGAGFYYDPQDEGGAGFKLYWVVFLANPAARLSHLGAVESGAS